MRLGEGHPWVTFGQRGAKLIPYRAHLGLADSAPTVNIQPVIGAIAFELSSQETAIFIKRQHLVAV